MYYKISIIFTNSKQQSELMTKSLIFVCKKSFVFSSVKIHFDNAILFFNCRNLVHDLSQWHDISKKSNLWNEFDLDKQF